MGAVGQRQFPFCSSEIVFHRGRITERTSEKPNCATCGIVAAHPPMEGHAVDWKLLVRLALLGSRDLEPYAILLVRVSLGLFFAISGANKLFVAASRQTMYETLVAAKVPWAFWKAYW